MSFDASIIRDLEDVDWDHVYPRLLRYAIYKCRKFEWLGTSTFDAESMAQEAVALVFGRGKDGNYRNWNRKKCPDLVKFLEGVVDSLVNHEFERVKTFRVESIDCEEQSANKVLCNYDLTKIDMVDIFSPMDPQKEMEMKENILRLVTTIREAAGGDEIAKRVVECLEQGVGKPREIADAIGIDVSKVYQILRFLRRKINILK